MLRLFVILNSLVISSVGFASMQVEKVGDVYFCLQELDKASTIKWRAVLDFEEFLLSRISDSDGDGDSDSDSDSESDSDSGLDLPNYIGPYNVRSNYRDAMSLFEEMLRTGEIMKDLAQVYKDNNNKDLRTYVAFLTRTDPRSLKDFPTRLNSIRIRSSKLEYAQGMAALQNYLKGGPKDDFRENALENIYKEFGFEHLKDVVMAMAVVSYEGVPLATHGGIHRLIPFRVLPLSKHRSPRRVATALHGFVMKSLQGKEGFLVVPLGSMARLLERSGIKYHRGAKYYSSVNVEYNGLTVKLSRAVGSGYEKEKKDANGDPIRPYGHDDYISSKSPISRWGTWRRSDCRFFGFNSCFFDYTDSKKKLWALAQEFQGILWGLKYGGMDPQGTYFVDGKSASSSYSEYAEKKRCNKGPCQLL